jgi:hypothetical protein
MFAPLLGIPYPVLTYERLKELHANGVTRLAHLGGTLPPNLVPYNVNHQITRCFLLDPKMDIQTEVDHLARLWAGPESAETLMDAWRFAEKAILAFPNVTPLYSTHGFTWYRLWLRPLVPDIEAIPREERAYYEDFMCTTPHNPNNVDLSRDVLFRLIQPEKAAKTVSRIDSRVWKPLDRALTLLSGNGSDPPVYDDQRVRLAALKCWLTTQRNTAAWVAGVYGFLNSRSAGEKRRHRKRIAEFIENEIANTRSLISLLDTGVEFMATAHTGETPLVHGQNLKPALDRRIRLMEAHREDIPRIDPDYMEKNAGIPVT